MSDKLMQGDNDTRGEFEMLLDEVLDVMANPEPVAGLQEKVMMRLRAAGSVVEDPGLRIEASEWGTRIFEVPRERRSLASTWFAVGLHAAAILLVGFLMARGVRFTAPVKEASVVSLDAPPLAAPPKRIAMGGGGGQPGAAPVSKGVPPKFSPLQILVPKASVIAPKLAVEPTIDVESNLKMATNMPDIGMANAPAVGVSMGNGRGNGLGGGNGNGMGPGSGGNTGGGIKQVGGGVSAPQLVYKPEAEYSEEARKAKAMGNVLVNLVVDEKGNVTRARVVQGLGMGLDEKAIEAVRQYRFRPAMENGKPVKVEVNVEIDFHIF
jgi:protein TonB